MRESLVGRLFKEAGWAGVHGPLMEKAANEILRLTAELEEARAALEAVRDALEALPPGILGEASEVVEASDGEAGVRSWTIRDELIDRVSRALRSEAQGEGWQVTEPARDIVRREMPETRATVREAIRAARRGEAPGDAALKHAMDNGFVRGVLHATEHVYEYGGSTHADELIEDLVDSFGPARVQGVARENGLSHSQRAAIEVARRLRAARLGEGGGE